MLVHGHNRRGKRTRLYRIWRDVVTRCHNPNHQQFRDYGGRGLQAYETWRNSFQAFRDDVLAEIGEPPPGALFGRIDTGLGYQPGNIKWATRTQQNRNRRTVMGSPDMATEVRTVYDPAISRKSGLTAQVLANELGVTVDVIRDIARRKTWKRVAAKRK